MDEQPVTVIDEQSTRVDALVDHEQATFLLTPEALESVLGWRLTPEGLCRGDACVSVGSSSEAVARDGRADVVGVARALRRAIVVDTEAGICALSRPAELRRGVLHDLRLPEIELPDLDGRPHPLLEWRGRKVLLVAFATWCGCCYDLPGWQALHDELEPAGLTVVAVALDGVADQVRPFAEGLTMPVRYDPNRVLPEVFAISNVPTVVWADEDGRIVRPPGVAHGSDLFFEFTGIESEPHLDAVRRWVRDGIVPISAGEAKSAVADLSEEEVLARLHYRVAAEAACRGDGATARRHVDQAAELAPDDLAVWRAAMPLVGEDPFGAEFLERYEAWRERGSPAHALAPIPSDP